ncbi:hypothetical protein KY290_002996 [Solanum tuberosum]|uniref:Uncharacterized protein n=1 Tax=Solanum tuberosum TaxID=4113 RepID=A0ABQ7WRN1_SOLTU|nr:hypothetical protein KY285_002965 [Solanum tuberosum]KAH0783398.1 hypothetical protein KY290_002996 [Solanum tuberosum]
MESAEKKGTSTLLQIKLVIWKALEKKGHPHCYRLVHSVAWNCSGTKLASGSVDQTGEKLT